MISSLALFAALIPITKSVKVCVSYVSLSLIDAKTKSTNQIGNVGLVTKFGKFYKCVDPGLVKVNPVTEGLKKIDITIQVTEIPKQDVITKVWSLSLQKLSYVIYTTV